MAALSVSERVGRIDWPRAESELLDHGHALSEGLLTRAECTQLIALYARNDRFRSRIEMDRLGFGSGSYAYFAEPLPRLVASLRTAFYRKLAAVANRAQELLGESFRYPSTLREYRRLCAEAGQRRPTPLMLRYEAGGYNRLHRDLYGPLRFPLQVAIGLTEPGVDFEGGQFLLVENRPRQQAIGEAIELGLGTAVVFFVSERPVEGRRGIYRAGVRHGVSRVRRGCRYTLGLIFHDSA